MINRKQIQKQFQDATISDNFIFGRTMETNSDLCRRLIEKILGIKVSKIEYPEREKDIKARIDAKAIRLDVYVEDIEGNRVFDVEMQTSNDDDLAKRTRYYQGAIDLDRLKKGKHYRSLCDSYIIFICPFDLFEEDMIVYTFQMFCKENKKIALKNGSTVVFLNSKGTIGEVDEDLKSFLNYMTTGIADGAFAKEFDDAVQRVKSKEEDRYMTYQMDLLGQRLDGEEEGRAAVALNLAKMNMPIETICKATELSKEKILSLIETFSKENQEGKS